MNHLLLPPVTPLVEEPSAAGGRQDFRKPNLSGSARLKRNIIILPPPVTPLVEEPIATGGRYF